MEILARAPKNGFELIIRSLLFNIANARTIDLNTTLFTLLNQQTQIVEEMEKRFSEAGNLEEAIDESLNKAEALRQSILNIAFAGRYLWTICRD